MRDLTYGRTFDNKNYSQLIDLGSLGYIKLADGGSGVLTATELSNVTDNVAETNYGARIELDPLNAFDGTVFMPAGTTNVLGTDAALLVRVNESDIDDVDIRAQLINVTGMYDNVSDDQFEIRLQTSGLIIEPKGGVDESEDNSDIQYYTTLHGTLVKADDQDNKYVIINYPKQEVEINAFIAPVAAQISTSGGNIATVTLDKINVGAARLASEISDVTKDNLILVGGACANAATATVEGVSQSEPDCIAGLQSGEAVIKLYDQSSGKVAMVVAGMDAMDTRRATRVISNFDAYNLSGSEVKVTGTSLTDIKVSMPS